MTAAVMPSARVRPDMSVWAAAAWKPAVLTAFALWVFLIGAHHEPWFDEAQGWLLARDSSLWQLLVERVRYEGTPGLWHLVLWIAIRARLPYDAIHLLPFACAVAGGAVVLWRAPFPPAMRIGILFSYFFAYQFAVVARSYTLDLLFIPLLACFFAGRVERPWRYALLIGLIANTNAYGFVAAIVLGLELAWSIVGTGAWRRPGAVASVVLAAALGLVALAVAWQPADNTFLTPAVGYPASVAVINVFRNAFIDRPMPWDAVEPDSASSVIGYLLTLALLWPTVMLVRRTGRAWLAGGIAAALIGFSAAVYSYHWHAGIFFLFWVFVLWICWPIADGGTRRRVMASALIICGAQAMEAARSGLWDYAHVYSSGHDTANAIAEWKSTHPRGKIAAFGYKAFGIQPWFARNQFANYHDGQPAPTYIRWDAAETWNPDANDAIWRTALTSRADLLVAAENDFLPQVMQPAARLAACYGWHPRAAYEGWIIWKGYKVADDNMILYERSDSRAGCKRANRAM